MVDTSYETARNVVYIATHTETGREYIGQTKQGLKARRKQHLKDARRENPTSYFTRALRKHGEDAFTWSVVWTVTNEELQTGVLDDLEEMTIAVNKTLAPNGFNISPGRRCGPGLRQRKRPEDNDLPDNIYSMPNGYKGVDSQSGRVRCFTDKRCTMEEKLDVVKAWLEEVKESGSIPPRHKKRKRDDHDDLPSYIECVQGKKHGIDVEGYRVRHPELPVKQFWKKRLSMEDKLQAAKDYLATAVE